MKSYLFIHEDIDDWVVDSGCLGKEGGDGSHPGIKFNGRMSCDQYGEGCVRCPAHHKCHNHHHHHTGHLSFRLPGTGQTTMRYLEETMTGGTVLCYLIDSPSIRIERIHVFKADITIILF